MVNGAIVLEKNQAAVRFLATRCKGGNIALANNSEYGQMGADGVCHVGRAQMGVMLFRHAGIGMAQLCRYDGHGNAFERKMAGMGMPQDMEAGSG